MATKKRATAKKSPRRSPAKTTSPSRSKRGSSKALKKKTKKATASKSGKKKTAGKGPASKTRAKTSRRPPAPARREPPPRRLSTFADAVKIYEAAVRLVHRERYDQARAEFTRLAGEYPNETELLDRANVLIQVCDKRLEDQAAGPSLKNGTDYYNVGVAEMNGGALDDARKHLERALELLPTADHVLYALGALSALSNEPAAALDYLSRSIAQRKENRFLAANDADFASLAEDADFIQLVSSDLA